MTAIVLACSLLPVVLQVVLTHRHPSLRGPTITSIVVVAYTLFFPLRGLSLLVLDLPSVELATSDDLTHAYRTMLVGATVGTTALVYSSALIARQAHPRTGLVLADGVPVRQKLALLSIITGVIALIGLGLLLHENDGFTGLAERYADHTKLKRSSAVESAALAAWLTFSPLACWASISLVCARLATKRRALIGKRRSGRLRIRAAAFPLGFVVFVALVLVAGFGSRKGLTAIAIGAAMLWHYHVRPVTWRTLSVVAPCAVLISLLIVSVRTDAGEQSPSVETVSSNLGHSVLDASAAGLTRSEAIYAEYDVRDRIANMPLYVIPRLVWPSGPSIDDRRMDVIVAREVGTANHANTGFPTSAFFEARLVGGLTGIALCGVLLGLLAGITHRALVGTRKPSYIATILYAEAAFLLLSWFKDGDAVAILAASVREFGYILAIVVPIGAARLVVRRTVPSRLSSPPRTRVPTP